MPKVSVIIPVYNVEKYLKECLDSVINQTLKDIEIVCVNDGSTDGSLEILKEYAQKDERVKVIDKDNEGAGAAGNDGLKVATGDYLLFFDADDYMGSEALEKLYQSSISTDSDIAICRSYSFIDGDNKFKAIRSALENNLIDNKLIFSPKEVKKYVFQFCVGWPWDKLYRRAFVLNNDLEFQNQHHSNDTKFVLLSLACAEKISIIEDSLVYHRNQASSVSNTRTKNPECFYNALMALKEELEKHNLYETYKQSFVNYCITFPMWHITTIHNRKAKRVMIKYFSKLLKKYINIKQYNQDYFYDKNAYRQAMDLVFVSCSGILRKIFSCANSIDQKHKIITILGIGIKIRRRNKNA